MTTYVLNTLGEQRYVRLLDILDDAVDQVEGRQPCLRGALQQKAFP